MPNPTAYDLRPVDPVATNFAIAHGNDLALDFVADQIAPPILGETSGTYFVWDIGDSYRREMKLVPDGAPAPIGGFRVGTETFNTLPYGLKTMLTDKVKARASLPKMADDAHVYYLMQQNKMNREYVFKEAVFKTGLWTGNTEQVGVSSGAGTNTPLHWSDSSSTPLLDIQEKLLTVRIASGKIPNALITNLDVSMALSRHSDFTGRVTGMGSSAQPAVVSEEAIAKIIWNGTGVEGKLVVAKAIHNTAEEEATDSLSDMYGKNALLAHVNPGANPTFDQARVTALATFTMSGYDGMTPTGATIKSWREEDPDGTWRRVQDEYVAKITAQSAAVFFSGIVA